MRDKRKAAASGLLLGLAVGGMFECLVALAGSAFSNSKDALYWAQIAGMLIGVIGVWLLARRLIKTDGPQIYRPGRTWLEMEYEVQDDHKKNERMLRESDGEDHRTPRQYKSGATLWMDAGILLSAALPLLAKLVL